MSIWSLRALTYSLELPEDQKASMQPIAANLQELGEMCLAWTAGGRGSGPLSARKGGPRGSGGTSESENGYRRRVMKAKGIYKVSRGKPSLRSAADTTSENPDIRRIACRPYGTLPGKAINSLRGHLDPRTQAQNGVTPLLWVVNEFKRLMWLSCGKPWGVNYN